MLKSGWKKIFMEYLQINDRIPANFILCNLISANYVNSENTSRILSDHLCTQKHMGMQNSTQGY